MRLGILGAEYTFVNLPSGVDFRFEKIKDELELTSGAKVYYVKGVRLRCILDFSMSWINLTQLELLKAIFNNDTDVLSFYLEETLYPGLQLNCKWINEFNFSPIPGTVWGYYTGSIELEGEVLTTVPAYA